MEQLLGGKNICFLGLFFFCFVCLFLLLRKLNTSDDSKKQVCLL